MISSNSRTDVLYPAKENRICCLFWKRCTTICWDCYENFWQQRVERGEKTNYFNIHNSCKNITFHLNIAFGVNW